MKREMLELQGVTEQWSQSLAVKQQIEQALSKSYNDIINFNLLFDLNRLREETLSSKYLRFFGAFRYIRALRKINAEVGLTSTKTST